MEAFLNKMCYIDYGDTIFMDNCCFLQRVENKLPGLVVYLAGVGRCRVFTTKQC